MSQKITIEQFFDKTRNNLEKKISLLVKDKKISNALKGGKRLRPLLLQLSFKSCTRGKETTDRYHRALEGSVSIELAHAASLIHDDIIDQDLKRRGKKAFHIKEGIPNAILNGHKMIARGFNIALSHGINIAREYVDCWNRAVNGEITEIEFNKKDLQNKKGISTKSHIFKKYKKIIDFKTASLFSSACKAGAMEAGMKGDILKYFSDYGQRIGLAYQLSDDLVDLEKGEMIDSVILPILSRVEGTSSIKKSLTKKKIKKIFTENEKEIKDFYITEIKKHVEKAEEISKADIIPNSRYKDLLVETPRYIVNKMLKEVKIEI